MLIATTSGWDQYELLDSGNYQRLERFGKYIIVRPDPQILWQPHLPKTSWDKADFVFKSENSDKGIWQNPKNLPDKWLVSYASFKFWAKLTPFKHTGIFPEQILNWQWIGEKIKNANRPINLLNLFAYTGISSLVASSYRARVTHLDASKPSITWAKENQLASSLADKPIRYILDDAQKFVQREIRRGNKYDAIIMDPPVYGHGPGGETWNFSKDFPKLLQLCQQVLTNNPLFIIVNAYAVTMSALTIGNVLEETMSGFKGKLEYGELALQEKNTNRLLSTGLFARWSSF